MLLCQVGSWQEVHMTGEAKAHGTDNEEEKAIGLLWISDDLALQVSPRLRNVGDAQSSWRLGKNHKECSLSPSQPARVTNDIEPDAPWHRARNTGCLCRKSQAASHEHLWMAFTSKVGCIAVCFFHAGGYSMIDHLIVIVLHNPTLTHAHTLVYVTTSGRLRGFAVW